MGFLKGLSKLGKFGTKVAEGGVNSLYELAVAWDPVAASEAEIEDMEKRFDTLNLQVSKAKQMAQKEQEESDAIQKLYGERITAAERIQETINAGNLSDTDKAEYDKALTQLVDMLEDMKPDMEREQQEAVDAVAFLKELEETAKMMSDKLKTARRDLNKAMTDMERAKLAEDRANQQAEQARVVAGLTTEADSVGSALNAMHKNTEDSQARADAARRKATLLAPTDNEGSNAIISKALGEVRGTEKKGSVSDRLSALKS